MSITINDGAKVLYQWDRGVKVTVSAPCKIVRVAREDDHVTVDLYPLVSGSTETVVIPDRMLSESGYLHISRVGFADGEEYVLETMRILVRHAAKPQTTAASTKEIADIQTIKMRMAAMERAAREGKFDGEDGVTPHVGENGNWYLGENDTGVKAQGDDGVTPHVGGNGNWWLGDVDTGVKAQGEDGINPHIGENGNWYIGDTDTGVKATGDDGITPHIGENGNWYIGEEDTGVFARNEDVSLYADDMYTSGILEKGAMQLKILEPSGSNVIRYEIESAVVYIKGIRRARGGFTTSTQAVSFERLMANILRLNEEKGTFSWRVAEVTRDGDNLVNIDNGEIYPARSGGYYDLIPYLVRIPAGATSITYDMVEDLRADERYCGYVRDRLAPAKVSELENDAGYVTDDQIENVITTEPQELTDAEKVQARANIGAAAAGEGGGGIDEITSDMVVGALGYTPADTDDVPTKVSELENDSGYITRLVSDLANYYDKSEVNSRLSQIPRFSIRVVSVLPTTNISETTVYLVKSGSGPDLYTEYIHVGGIWEILGSQRVDLTGYATEEYVIAYVTADRIKQLLGYTPASTTELEQVRARAEVTPDLAQNDENADDYVKGRTHWCEKVARVVVPAREKGTHYIPVTAGTKDLAAGKTYNVLAGGTEYSCTAYKGLVSELLYIGDSRLYDGPGNLNKSAHPENVPFLLEVFVSSSVGDDSTETALTVWHSMSDERTTVSVIEPGVYDDGYRPIDDGYLPDSAARTDSSVMHDRTQNLDDGHKSIARKNIGALAEDQLPTAIDTALAQAKASGAFDGADGVTPHIGDNGNWFIGETDTGVNAHGDDGITPHIGDNGNWFIGDTDTGVKAQGKDGKAGMIDSIMTSVLYTDGVLVSDDEPDGLKVTYGTFREDSLCYNIERGAVIINGHAKSFNGVGSYFRDLNTDADQKIVFGYRYDAATGDIEQKIWYNCRPFITQADGFPLRYFADGETNGIPAKAISGNTGYYDVLVSLLEIPAGATETTPEMFTDLRGIERFCGFVKSKLSEGVSEDELSAAVEDALEQAKASGNFKGDPGEKGEKGDPGEKGEKGDPGEKGETGAAGTSPTTSLTKEGKVTTFSVTDANGTQTVQIHDGADGASGSGGGAGIDVTAEVGQTIVVTEVDDEGKPTKWEAVDYQPRTHWDEKVAEVLAETTLEYSEDMECFVIQNVNERFEKNQTYAVCYNGVEYLCTSVPMKMIVDEEGTWAELGVRLGNIDLVDGIGDTGEPFLILAPYPEYAEMLGGIAGAVSPIDGSESVTLSIARAEMHRIPEEYLPPYGHAEFYDIECKISQSNASLVVTEGECSWEDVCKLLETPNTVVRLKFKYYSNGVYEGLCQIFNFDGYYDRNGFDYATGYKFRHEEFFDVGESSGVSYSYIRIETGEEPMTAFYGVNILYTKQPG